MFVYNFSTSAYLSLGNYLIPFNNYINYLINLLFLLLLLLLTFIKLNYLIGKIELYESSAYYSILWASSIIRILS